LLDRLQRLADLRDRGLLGLDEYETVKESAMRELEARSRGVGRIGVNVAMLTAVVVGIPPGRGSTAYSRAADAAL
jgi:hypothetical protein